MAPSMRYHELDERRGVRVQAARPGIVELCELDDFSGDPFVVDELDEPAAYRTLLESEDARELEPVLEALKARF